MQEREGKEASHIKYDGKRMRVRGRGKKRLSKNQEGGALCLNLNSEKRGSLS